MAKSRQKELDRIERIDKPREYNKQINIKFKFNNYFKTFIWVDEMKVDMEIVFKTYLKVRGNIRNKKKIFYFELLLYSNINYIVDRINNNTYLFNFIFYLYVCHNYEYL